MVAYSDQDFNTDNLSPEQIELIRQDIIVKLNILRQQFPDINIPEVDNNTYIGVLHSIYLGAMIKIKLILGTNYCLNLPNK